MRTMPVLYVLICVAGLLVPSSEAGKLMITTLQEPPASFTDDKGRLSGFSTEVVREIQKRVGNTDPIRIYPWARSYQNALKFPNVVAFTAARTKEREDRFHWICKMSRNRYAFFAKKGSRITLGSFEGAKQLKGIGVLRSSVWEQDLIARGFTNLDPVATHELNLRKLMAGRFPVIYYTSSGFSQHCDRFNMDCSTIYPVYSTPRIESYIIMSKNGTPAKIVNKWKNAADEIKKDGTFERIAKKWIAFMKSGHGVEFHYADRALNYWPLEGK